MADNDDRLSAVFEMLITRLTDMEQRQLLAEQRERRLDELRPAGARLCGLIHCGRPVTVVKNYGERPIRPGDYVIVTGAGVLDGYRCSVYYDMRIAKLGAEVHQALLDADAAALASEDGPDWTPALAADHGFPDTGHELLDNLMVEMTVRERFPAVKAAGDDALLLRGVEGGLGGALRMYQDVRAMLGFEVDPAEEFEVYTVGSDYAALAAALVRGANHAAVVKAVRGLTTFSMQCLLGACTDDDRAHSFFYQHREAIDKARVPRSAMV